MVERLSNIRDRVVPGKVERQLLLAQERLGGIPASDVRAIYEKILKRGVLEGAAPCTQAV